MFISIPAIRAELLNCNLFIRNVPEKSSHRDDASGFSCGFSTLTDRRVVGFVSADPSKCHAINLIDNDHVLDRCDP